LCLVIVPFANISIKIEWREYKLLELLKKTYKLLELYNFIFCCEGTTISYADYLFFIMHLSVT